MLIRDERRAGFFTGFVGSGSKILNTRFRAGFVLAPGSGYPDENPEIFGFFYLKVKNGSQTEKSERLKIFSRNENLLR